MAPFTAFIVLLLLLLFYCLDRWMSADRELESARNNIPTAGLALGEEEARALDLYMREWQVVIQTQMHFNDLIIRFRTMALTAFVALVGGAVAIGNALQLQSDTLYLTFLLPGSFWFAALFIDYFYYHQLLLGSVAQAAKFDDSAWLRDRGFFGLTHCVRDHARPGISRIMVALFYAVPVAGALLIMKFLGPG